MFEFEEKEDSNFIYNLQSIANMFTGEPLLEA